MSTEIFYADAAFNVKTKKAQVGFCTGLMTHAGVKTISAKDNNEAEIQAVKYCAEQRAGQVKVIYTDSEDAVRYFTANPIPGVQVVHLTRMSNPAHHVVYSQKELKS